MYSNEDFEFALGESKDKLAYPMLNDMRIHCKENLYDRYNMEAVPKEVQFRHEPNGISQHITKYDDMSMRELKIIITQLTRMLQDERTQRTPR